MCVVVHWGCRAVVIFTVSDTMVTSIDFNYRDWSRWTYQDYSNWSSLQSCRTPSQIQPLPGLNINFLKGAGADGFHQIGAYFADGYTKHRFFRREEHYTTEGNMYFELFRWCSGWMCVS